MKTTPLHSTHVELGAKMTGFAGYDMPVVYSTIRDEHMAVRNHVGLFDVSHMGEFFVSGEGATELVQKVTSNDVKKLSVGQAQYSCLPNRTGGIVDDLLVYKLAEGEEEYMLVVNAGNIDKDYAWIASQNHGNTDLKDHSTAYSLLALQGPKAEKVLNTFLEEPLDIKFYHFTKGDIGSIQDVIISATGYTGSGGYELYVRNDQVQELWNLLLPRVLELGGLPCGLGARDTLRLEMGYCLYGQDITDDTSPIEAGLGWITKLKTDDFVGKDAILSRKAAGIKQKLTGFVLDSRRVARTGYSISDADGNEIGTVTSGSLSPMLECPIGLGYINSDLITEGASVFIDMGKKKVEATIKKAPFVEVD